MIELIINIGLFAIGLFAIYYIAIFAYIGIAMTCYVIAVHYDKILIAISVIVGISYVTYQSLI